MMGRARTAVGACLVALLAVPAVASPRSIEHVVAPGETVEGLATKFYGDRAMALFIRERNALGRERLRAGDKVEIPTAFKVEVERGDTLQKLAASWLGDARRARFLGEWNGLREKDPLEPGTRLTVPFHLVHRARAPESLASLAKTFYGDPGQGRLLAAYNFRKGTVLATGERLLIPVPHVVVKPALAVGAPRASAARKLPVDKSDAGQAARSDKSDAAQAARSDKSDAAQAARSDKSDAAQAPRPDKSDAAAVPARPEAAPVVAAAVVQADTPTARIAERIRLAERAFHDGGYEEAQTQLARVLADGGATSPQLIAVHRLLGFVYVALGADDDAVREFRDVLARDPALSLDESVSPKIRMVFERARSKR